MSERGRRGPRTVRPDLESGDPPLRPPAARTVRLRAADRGTRRCGQRLGRSVPDHRSLLVVPSGHARRGFETLAPDARRRLRRPARVPDDRRSGTSSRADGPRSCTRSSHQPHPRPLGRPRPAGCPNREAGASYAVTNGVIAVPDRRRGLPDVRRGRRQQGCGAVRGDSAARSASAQSSSSETSRPRRRASGSRSSSRIHSASSRVSTNRATASR